MRQPRCFLKLNFTNLQKITCRMTPINLVTLTLSKIIEGQNNYVSRTLLGYNTEKKKYFL